MYIKAITTEEEFDKIKNEWIDFEKKVDNKNITSSYLHQRTWWKHFGHIDNSQYGFDKKLLILFLYNDDNELRAIAPFCIVKRKLKKIFHYTIAEFIAQQWGASYLDFISSDLSKNEFDYIFDWLKKNRKYDLIHLCYIPEFTSNFDLKSENVTVLSGCPEINNLDYQYISNNYSKHLKQNIRTAYNKIAKHKIKIENKISGKNESELFYSIIKVSKSKLVDKKHSVYLDKIKKNFLKDIYNIMDFNCVQINFNDNLVSYRTNLIYNNRKFCLDASFDRNYRKYDLGALSVDENIKDSVNKKFIYHCFGTGIDSYKLKFTKKVCKIYNVLYKGNTLKSGLIYKKKLLANKQLENNFLKELNEKILKEK